VSKVEFFEVYRRLEEFISSGGTSGANNALEAKFDAKMAMMATKGISSTSNLTTSFRECGSSRKGFRDIETRIPVNGSGTE
jgi:hypothetical protein